MITSDMTDPQAIPTSQARAVVETLLSTGSVVARLDGSVHNLFPVAIGPREGAALRDWVEHEKATRTIEVGLGFGVSSLFVLQGLIDLGQQNAVHVVIDPYQETRYSNCGLQVLEDAGVAHLVEFHLEPSETTLPRFLAEKRSFDFAFLDGNHRFESVFLDLIYLGRCVRGGGVLFVDDYQLPAIARAVSFCTTNLGWTIEEESWEDEYHRWVVLRTPSEPIQREFDYFVSF